jgi:hypothetical protein
MASENAAVDLNDPATWPDDIEALTALQEELVAESPAETGDTGEVAAKEEEKAEVEEKTPAEPEEEKKSDDVQADPVKPEPVEAKEEEKAEDENPEPSILARDGKNTLPFGVLAGEREKNAKLSQRNADLEAELERLRTTASTPTEVKAAEAPVAEFEVTAELQGKYDQLKEDWGEEIAENYIETKRIQHDNLKLREKLDAIEKQTTETAATQRSTQEAQVQEAIDSSPDMALWQSQEGGEMYDKALAVHQTLMTTDSEYASMSWYDRMQSLPKRTRAMYGVAEEPAATPEPASNEPAVSQEEIAEKAKTAAANAESKPPHSMSDLPKGDTPVERTELEKLEGSEPADIQRKLMELSNNPEAYERYLNSLM